MKDKPLIVLTAIGLLAIVAVVASRFASLDALADQEQQLRDAIAASPATAWAVGFVVYYFISLVPGTSGKSIVLGWLYGFWHGVLLVVLALTAAAVTMFSVSRYGCRESVETRFTSILSRLNRAVAREGAFYLLTLRMLHVPFSLVNIVAGASRIAAVTFTWTTAVGLLPGTAVFVFVGSQLPSLNELRTHGTIELLNPWLLAALIGMGGLPLATRWCVSWLGPRLVSADRNPRTDHFRPGGNHE